MSDKLKFSVIESEITTPDKENSITYGLMVQDQTGSICLCVEDISTSIEIVGPLAKICNEHDVSLVHVMDIIEDALG